MAVAGALCTSAPAHAQITTDGTLRPAQAFNGLHAEIPADAGRQAGGNLFHSFGLFNVHTGGSATFLAPVASSPQVANIISRVTGGAASSIDGVLRSQIAGANLFLINPSGILFGPNASLDLSGSFFASTANYLKFADGTRFDAAATANPVLTSAPPAAFGFLGPSGAITVQGSSLGAAPGQSINLVGGPVTMSDASLKTFAGDIRLVGAGSAGEVSLAGNVITGAALAPIGLQRSALSTESANGVPPGRILIRGGQLRVSGSTLASTNNEQADAPPLELAAGVDLTVSASSITSETGWSGGSANIALSGDNVTVDRNSQVGSITWGDGRGGDINLTARGAARVVAAAADPGYTNVYSWAFGNGDGGHLRLSGDTVTVQSGNAYSYTDGGGTGGSISLAGREVGVTTGGWVYAYNGAGPGRTGDIALSASKHAFVGGLDWFGNQAFVFTQALGAGAGNVSMTAPAIDVIGGRVQSYTVGAGNTGALALTGNVVRLLGGNGSFAMVDTTVAGGSTGSGGDINIRAADAFEISRGSEPGQWTRLSTSTFSTGRAGSMNVQAGSIRILDGALSGASIWAGSGGSGRGGNVDLRATGEIVVTGGALIDTLTWDRGRGGDVALRAPSIRIEGGSIHTMARGSGDAGHVLVEGESVRLAGTSVRGAGIGSWVDHYASGRGGDIVVRASRAFEFDGTANLSSLHAETRFASTGDGGNVTIEAGQVVMRGPAHVYVPTNGSGNGGTILIRAHDIDLGAGTSIASDNPPWGGGRGANITIEGTGRLTLAATGAISPFDHWHLHHNDAQIVAWTGGIGRAGDVSITIPEIQAHLNSQIVSYTFGSGDAGTITINADRVRLADTTAIVTSTEQSSGNAGRIVLNIGERFEMSGRGTIDNQYAGLRLASRGGVLSTSAGSGDAGSVVLRAPEVVLDDARIQTSTLRAGEGGRIEIYAGDLFLRNGGQIDVKALDGSIGNAGAIVIEAANRLEISGVSTIDTGFSGVNAETLGAGRGGNVRISAGTLLVDRGFVRSSTGGSGDAGTVDVRAREVFLVNGGSIDAGTAPGSAGAGGSVNVSATSAITVRGVDTTAGIVPLVVHDNPLFGGFFTAGRPQGIFASTIASNTAGSGAGGSVTLSAPSIRIEDGARVSATSTGTGDAGSINIAAADALRLFGGAISSEALRADGGNIDVRVGNLVHLKNSEISTAVGSGAGAGGNIFIDPTFVILQDGSRIVANAFGGPGGNIQIFATYFLNTLDSLVDASSQAGLPGTVSITAPNTNLSTQLKVLPSAFFDATQLVREACAGRGVASGGGSSLVGVGRGGLAASPERFATSTYFAATPAATSNAAEPTGLKLVSTKHARLAANCSG